MHKTAVTAAAVLALTSIALTGAARAQTPDFLTNAEDCPKAVGEPGTSWICPDPDMTPDKARAIAAEAEGSQAADATNAPEAAGADAANAAVPITGRCLSNGCWEILDDENKYPQITQFTSSGGYGVYDQSTGKSTTLGHFTFYFKVTAKQNVLTVGPTYFTSTREVVNKYTRGGKTAYGDRSSLHLRQQPGGP